MISKIKKNIIGYFEKLGFSFKIKAYEKFYHRHMFDIGVS